MALISSGVAPSSEDRRDGVALLDDDRTLVPVAAARGLAVGLRQQRDVFRHDAGFEAGIGIGVPSAA